MSALPLLPLGRTTSRVLFAAMVIGGTLAGCNLVLGIEEQEARSVPDEAGSGDATNEGSAEAGRQTIEKCAVDTDCVAPNACYTPHCDTVLGACTYALCEAKGRTCAMGACNTATFACSDPLPYTFRTSTYDIPGVTSGCGPNPNACVAAAFPFVFIGTRDDVIAVRADDFVGKQAEKVPIENVTVKPQQIIASGRRIWVLGAVQGQSPPYQIVIAAIDVASDPTVKALRARTTVLGYPFPSAVGFPAPNGNLYLAYNEPAQGFPTALVTAPIADGASIGLASAAGAGTFDASVPPAKGTITMYRVGGAPPGSGLAASSGARLLAYRYPSTFNLIANAGTETAAVQPDVGLNQPLVGIGPQTFAQGPDGVVMMSAPIAADPANDCNCTTHERLQWVLPNAIATTTDVNQILDPEVYTNAQVAGGLCHQCALDYVRSPMLATWLDRRSALTAAPFTGGPAARMLTDVRFLGRDPFDGNVKRRAQTKATDMPKGDFALDRIALTSSNGIGYLVLADGQGNDLSMSTFDPRCDNE
jgi:hypothetical protein